MSEITTEDIRRNEEFREDSRQRKLIDLAHEKSTNIDYAISAKGIYLEGFHPEARKMLQYSVVPLLEVCNEFLNPEILPDSRKIELSDLMNNRSIQILGYNSSLAKRLESEFGGLIVPHLVGSGSEVYIETSKNRAIVWVDYDYINVEFQNSVENMVQGVISAFVQICSNREDYFLEEVKNYTNYYNGIFYEASYTELIKLIDLSTSVHLANKIGHNIAGRFLKSSPLETQTNPTIKVTEERRDLISVTETMMQTQDINVLGQYFAEVIFNIARDEICEIHMIPMILKYKNSRNFLRKAFPMSTIPEIVDNLLYKNPVIKSIISKFQNKSTTLK